MRKLYLFVALISVVSINAQSITSPSKNISLDFKLSNDGKPTYSVNYKTKSIVKESALGIELKGTEPLKSGFSILNQETQSVNSPWNPVLGEKTTYQNKYNEIKFYLIQKATNRKLNIIFKSNCLT